MIRFRWRGIVFDASFHFFAVAALIGLLCGGLIFVQFFTACLLHELGHLFVLYGFGRRVRRVHFSGAGVLILPEAEYGAYWQDILILLAGPLANLIFGSILILCVDMTAYAAMHIGLGLFNLLPYRCLDGGSVLDALLRTRDYSPRRIFWIENVICSILSAGLILLMMQQHMQQFSLLAMIVYLTFIQHFGSDR